MEAVGQGFPVQVVPDVMLAVGARNPRRKRGGAGLTHTVFAPTSFRISWSFQTVTKIHPFSSEAGDVSTPRWGPTGGFQFGILPELGVVSTGIHLFISSVDR